MAPDRSDQPPKPTHQEQDTLQQAGILTDADLQSWPRYLTLPVTLAQAALFLGESLPGWLDDNGRPNLAYARGEIWAGRLGKTGLFGLRYYITIEDLLRYNPDHPAARRLGLSVVHWMVNHKVITIIASTATFLIAVVAIFAQIYAEQLRWWITPPQATLTLVIDASETMAQPLSNQMTLWQAAVRVAQDKIDHLPFPEHERVALWVQRAQRAQGSRDCLADYEFLTQQYVEPDEIDVVGLLEGVELRYESDPGQALLTAVRNMPTSRLRPIAHEAIVISSGRTTCRGATPVGEICEQLSRISEQWETLSNTKLTHRIIVINLDAGHVRSEERKCYSEEVLVKTIDLDRQDVEASNDELCLSEPDLCGVPLFVTSTTTVQPPQLPSTPQTAPPPGDTPTTRANTREPAATPSVVSTTQLRKTPPIRVTVLSPPVTARPMPVATVSNPLAKSTDTPTPTPGLRIRAFTGRSAAVREACNQGRVIGEIGELLARKQHIEAEIPMIPTDLQLLADYGCIRVFTGILGDPTHGYFGYVQANDVCIIKSSYDFWRIRPGFSDVPGIDKLVRCPD